MSKSATYLRGLATAAALTFSVGSANAVVVDWGTHDPVEAGANIVFGFGSSIFDVFKFSLLSSNAQAAAISLEGLPTFDISGGLVALFNDDGDANFTNDSLIDSFAFDSTQIGYSFGVLITGSYYYRVTGTVASSAGSYLIGSNISAVPVPPALLLLGSSLLGLAGLRRRKHRTS